MQQMNVYLMESDEDLGAPQYRALMKPRELDTLRKKIGSYINECNARRRAELADSEQKVKELQKALNEKRALIGTP